MDVTFSIFIWPAKYNRNISFLFLPEGPMGHPQRVLAVGPNPIFSFLFPNILIFPPLKTHLNFFSFFAMESNSSVACRIIYGSDAMEKLESKL